MELPTCRKLERDIKELQAVSHELVSRLPVYTLRQEVRLSRPHHHPTRESFVSKLQYLSACLPLPADTWQQEQAPATSPSPDAKECFVISQLQCLSFVVLEFLTEVEAVSQRKRWWDHLKLLCKSRDLVRRCRDLDRRLAPDWRNILSAWEQPGGTNSLRYQPRLDLPEREAAGLFGIDGPKMAIVGWLQHEESSRKVVAIVGPVGSGKTTLAAQVYHEISGQFECSVHVKASSSVLTDSSVLFQHMLSLLDPDDHQNTKSEKWIHLSSIIEKFLKVKRYIILIDDIGDSGFLTRIFYAFPENKRGSQILITTRITSVADHVASEHGGLVLRMKPLNEIDHQKLLFWHLTDPKDSCDPARLKLVSDKIHKRYDGKPLAIVAIANTMKQQASSPTLTCLEEFSKLEKGPNQEGQIERFLPIYNDLSHDMRCWLLYLSLFRNYNIDKDRLIRRWVPEGFVTPLRKYDEFTEAEKCFDKLLDRNIIQPVKQGKCYSDAGTYKSDYFMLQVILQMSPLKNLIMRTSDKLHLIQHNKVLHLSLYSPDPKLDEVLGEKDLSLVHSLTIFDQGAQVIDIDIAKFTDLHVLDVQGWTKLDDEGMLKICRVLKKLKYLNIRNTKVRNLPHRIKNLRFLETLDIRQTRVSFLPPEVSELQFLQALYVSQTNIKRLPTLVHKLHRLVKLDLRETEITELPIQGSWLRNLLHLLAGSEDPNKSLLKMPKWISHASLLRTLATVDLSECLSETVRSLGDLKELNELAIIWSCDQSVKKLYQAALRSSIEKMEKLKYLAIYGEFGCSMEFMCDLPRPPKKLEKLILNPRLVSVPQWVKSLKDLVLLNITVCKFEATDLTSLAGLPKLRCLEIGLEFHLKQEIKFKNEGFKFLERFSVACRVPWLTFEQGAMPRLTELELKSSALAGQDRIVLSGIHNLVSLDQVFLHSSTRYGSNPTIDIKYKEVDKYFRRIKVFNNDEEYDQASKVGSSIIISEIKLETKRHEEPSPSEQEMHAKGEHGDKVPAQENSNPKEAAPTATSDRTSDGKLDLANEHGPSTNRYYFNAVLQSCLAFDNLRMTMLRQDPLSGSLPSELNMVFMDTNGANDTGRNLDQNLFSEICSKQTKFHTREMPHSLRNESGEEADATNIPKVEDSPVRMRSLTSSDPSEQTTVKSEKVFVSIHTKAISSAKNVAEHTQIEGNESGKAGLSPTLGVQKVLAFPGSPEDNLKSEKSQPMVLYEEKFQEAQGGSIDPTLCALFLPYHVMLELPWPMRLLHDWYLRASEKGLGMISVKVPDNAFIDGPNGNFIISFNDLQAFYKMEKMDINLVGAWCLSQWVDAQRMGASIGYANPTRVCMTAHTVRLNLDGPQLKNKTPEERKEYVDRLHKNKRVEVATYLGKAMLMHADKRVLMVPYHLTDHYILFLVYPRDHLVVVLDPAHYDEQKFMEFLVLLNLGHDYYKRHGGFVKDQQRTKLIVKAHWPCYKQPPGTSLCGYYVCEMLRVCGRYRTEFTDLPSIPSTANHFDKKTLLNLCGDLCRFIRRDICNHLGEFYDPESELASDDKFKRLREWEKEHAPR